MNELEAMQRKMDRQTDTYMNMFDAICEERKYLLAENTKLEKDMGKATAQMSDRDWQIRSADKEITRITKEFAELQRRIR